MWQWIKRLLAAWLFPERKSLTHSRSEGVVSSDLDSLIADPIYFKWNGRIHEITPMDTKTFFQTCQSYQTLLNTRELKSETGKEFIDAYGDFFSSVCKTIGRKEVAQMTIPQVAALTQHILDAISGKVQGDSGKKKSMTPQ